MCRLRDSIYTNNEIIRKKNLHLRILDRKLRQLEIMLQAANKDPNYNKVMEIVALVAVLNTLKANPYGLNLLNSSLSDQVK
jgi:hypothetical protein